MAPTPAAPTLSPTRHATDGMDSGAVEVPQTTRSMVSPSMPACSTAFRAARIGRGAPVPASPAARRWRGAAHCEGDGGAVDASVLHGVPGGSNREGGAGLVLADEAALADAGARRDPVVRGVQDVLQVLVGNDPAPHRPAGTDDLAHGPPGHTASPGGRALSRD